MEKFLKIKKSKFAFFLLLLFNQFFLNGYASNFKKIYLEKLEKTNLEKRIDKSSNLLLAEKNKDNINIIKKEEKEIQDFANEIEDFLEETYDSNNFIDFENNETNKVPIVKENVDALDEPNIDKNNEKNKVPLVKENVNALDEPNTDKNNEKNNSTKEQKKLIIKSEDKEIIIRKDNLIKKGKEKLPLPSRSIISTSEFKVPSRGYVMLNGPKITLNLQNVDSIETLKTIAKLGKYGIVVINENNSNEEKPLNQPKINANFENADISDVFNSILLSSNLQAVVENNIIFVGEYIINKSLKPKISKTFRLNQVNAASVADYLSTLGAQISKVSVLSGSVNGEEIGDSFLNKKVFKDEAINSYGIEGGPLLGLVGTADLRLQTVTLIGTKDQIKTAEKYINDLDIRHRQVALNIKIIDVSLTKSDIKNNLFELKLGDTEFISNSGLSLATANFQFGPNENSNISNVVTGGLSGKEFINWLEAKITNENAKILASPTLILGENPNILSSGAASADDGLSSATIGRPFKNEGFIKVGETVVTGFSQSNNDGVVTCTASEGTAGITFGAKVDKIDDNGYVTFALSPAISAVTKTVEITGCGIQNTLSIRKLDTGSIRVKNNDTLILTGVLQDADNVTSSKVPILGDIPILGGLFRSNPTQKRKSELVILVTPRILKDK